MSSSQVNLEECRIPLKEIIRATQNFSSHNWVGDGGFGSVYRGQLSERWKNHLVAIKRLDRNSYQGTIEFTKEVNLVSSFNHPNIIQFVGYCDDANEKIIVFKYASNSSLDRHLGDPEKRRILTWEQRLKICLGAARGVKYLHSGVEEHNRIIHRDFKSANILLDDNLEAKICDFGLSLLSPRNQGDTHVRTKIAGTPFYVDPSYMERCMLSKESDIYSFGVVMFEISSGMMAYHARRFEDTKELYLIDLVRSYYDDHGLVDGLQKLIDPTIRAQIDMSSFEKFNEIAHDCINLDVRKRPTVDRIIKTIAEALNIQTCGMPKGFDSAAYSDAFWERLLPSDYRELIARAVSPLDFSSKKKLYLSLSYTHILLDRGYLSFQLDIESGKKCYMLGAKELSIRWKDDPQFWEWEHAPESRFPEVCILKGLYWLSIHGKIASVMLSPNSTYKAYLVFRTSTNSEGLSVTAKTTVSFGGLSMVTENVYLQRPEVISENWQENDVLPRRRKDGWMEINLGEFEYNEGDDGEIEMAFEEVKHLNRKSGLIVEGIELRPKSTQHSPFVKLIYTPKPSEREMVKEAASLSVLPQECLSHILSLTSPRDACRAASISKGFNSAAESNAVWEEFLPQDYREIISRRMVFPLSLGSKKRLYLLLSNSHILLHPGNLSFQLDKESGKKCYMLGAKELSITWQHDTQYWEWTHIPESRFPEVCILKQVCWLSIHGRIVAGMLSQNSTYDAYLVFRTTEDSRGLSVPAKTRLSFGGSKMETENVYLQRPHHVQENYVFPHKRKDGWMEIKLGEFDYNEGDNGKVEMAYEEIKLGHWKTGLIVEGIELRPK